VILQEANLADFIIDLHDQYGTAWPRPQGQLVHFKVIHNNTTYLKAKAEIEALLELHGLSARKLSVVPGPEVKGKVNRTVQFSADTDLLT
jgi:hypothetical protein